MQNKANGAYQQLKSFSNNRIVSTKTKIRAFNAIIRNVCTYDILVWGAASKNNFKWLDGTHKQIMPAIIARYSHVIQKSFSDF